MSPVSKSQQKATAKYESVNYDKFLIRVPKGKKESIAKFAEKQGKSLNGFVNEAIDEKMMKGNE